ncbi:MAG: hypothetical protein KVP17_001208 [Porospora cf. gigantea B]|uniref:uncharacterized protein n=2 Tax=Porospora cf. gigantea B TaxID=2853592 RepID=UPI003571B4E2|nr:MAG: hypothetical protein KVP17_001208 [Porospora cf. gigantea B]
MRTSLESKPYLLKTCALQSFHLLSNQCGPEGNSGRNRGLQRNAHNPVQLRRSVAFRDHLTDDSHRSSSLPRPQSQIERRQPRASRHMSHEFLDDMGQEHHTGIDTDYMEMRAPTNYVNGQELHGSDLTDSNCTQTGMPLYYVNGQELQDSTDSNYTQTGTPYCTNGQELHGTSTESEYMPMGMSMSSQPRTRDSPPRTELEHRQAAPAAHNPVRRSFHPLKEQPSPNNEPRLQFDASFLGSVRDAAGKRFILIPETEFQAASLSHVHSRFRESCSPVPEKQTPKKKKGVFKWFTKSKDEKKKPQEARDIPVSRNKKIYRQENLTSAGSTSASSQGSDQYSGDSPRCSPSTYPQFLSETDPNYDDAFSVEDTYHTYMEVLPDDDSLSSGAFRQPSPPAVAPHAQLGSRRSNSPQQLGPRPQQLGPRRSNSPPQQFDQWRNSYANRSSRHSNSAQHSSLRKSTSYGGQLAALDMRAPQPTPRPPENSFYSEVNEFPSSQKVTASRSVQTQTDEETGVATQTEDCKQEQNASSTDDLARGLALALYMVQNQQEKATK